MINLFKVLKDRITLGKEYKKMVFEFSLKEGADFETMKLTEVAFDGENRSHYLGKKQDAFDTIRFYLKPVGFRDLVAPMRNWGTSFRPDAKIGRYYIGKSKEKREINNLKKYIKEKAKKQI